MATVPSTATSRIVRLTQPRTTTNPPMPASSGVSRPPLPLPTGGSRPPMALSRAAETPAHATPPGRVQIVDHPAAQHALTILCNKDTGQYDLRASSNHLLVLLTLEAMRSLPTRPLKVDAARENWNGLGLAKPVVLLAVSRDGVSLSHNLMDCVPGLLVGSVTLTPAADNNPLRARLHLPSAPALRDCRVLLFDPVVQTGTSAGAALELVRQLGATDVSLLTFTTSAQALLRLQAAFDGLHVWAAHVDETWDPKRAPVSLLGDFGPRLFI